MHPYVVPGSRKDPIAFLRRFFAKKPNKIEVLGGLNFDLDHRHFQKSPITPALTSDDCGVRVCVGCRRAVTEWENRHFGCCPTCGGHVFIGGFGTFFSELRIWIWNVTKNWRTHGPCPVRKHSPEEAESLAAQINQDETGDLTLRL